MEQCWWFDEISVLKCQWEALYKDPWCFITLLHNCVCGFLYTGLEFLVAALEQMSYTLFLFRVEDKPMCHISGWISLELWTNELRKKSKVRKMGVNGEMVKKWCKGEIKKGKIRNSRKSQRRNRNREQLQLDIEYLQQTCH